MGRIWQKVLDFFKDLQIINRNKATELLEFEVMELENIFSLLLFGSFTGMPSPPAHITLQLLPLMERELKLMFNRIGVAHDALAEVVSILGEP
ncbi:hypothetical protein ES703_74244 [subsurface metagenome]